MIAAPPITAIICAAGPVRTCHSNNRLAAIPGSAAPRMRRRSSRSPQQLQASSPKPIAPVIGKATINVATRQPCR